MVKRLNKNKQILNDIMMTLRCDMLVSPLKRQPLIFKTRENI